MLERRLIFPLDALRRALREAAHAPDRSVNLPLGISRGSRFCEWLVGARTRADAPATLRVLLSDSEASPRSRMQRTTVMLRIGFQRRRGSIAGAVTDELGQVEPLHELYLPGSGMHRFRLEGDVQPFSERAASIDGALSRSIAALGVGAWERMCDTSFGIIGASRNGSQMIRSLLQIGVRRLVIVDPARLAIHHLGEMDDAIGINEIGQNKAEVAARIFSEH